MYEKIYNRVIQLCQYKDGFDRDKYDRVIHHINKAANHVDYQMRKLLKYAGLLHPVQNIFYSLDYSNLRNIITDVNLTMSDETMTDKIISIIKNKKSLLYDCIRLDSMSPESLYDKACYMLRCNIPLYTYRTPLVRDKNNMNRICFRHKKVTTFMEYLYHEALFITDRINKNNPYILYQANIYHNHIISLILKFGSDQEIELKFIKTLN